ncbi:MAG: DMT family transporter [Acidimicrobiia bacterium]
MQWKIWGAIVAASFGWGTIGVATRAALNNGVPPIGMAAIRAVMASIVLYAILLARHHRPGRDRQRWRIGFIAGVFNLSVPFILFTLAYQYASAGFVGLLNALMPLGTATVAHFLLPDEPMRVSKMVGLSVAFLGVSVLLISGDSGLASGGQPLLAGFLTIGAVASISFSTVYVRGKVGGFDPLQLTFMQTFVGVFIISTIMFIVEGVPTDISAQSWALIIYLTFAGSVIPTIILYWLLQRVTSTTASLVGYVVPLIALVAGIVFLNEVIQLGIAIGGTLILVGIVLTDRSERRGPVRA